jgi:hypothetical protein
MATPHVMIPSLLVRQHKSRKAKAHHAHYEDPSPTSIASKPIQTSNSVSQQAAESSSKDGSAEEQIEAPLELVALVVHRNEIHATCRAKGSSQLSVSGIILGPTLWLRTRKEACFEQPEQETHGDQTGLVLNETLSDCGDTPEEHDGCEPC